MANKESIPDEIQKKLVNFHNALDTLEEMLKPFLARPLEEIEASSEPILKARIDLMSIFTANSMFWIHIRLMGECPPEHLIFQELKRIRAALDRMKEIEKPKR